MRHAQLDDLKDRPAKSERDEAKRRFLASIKVKVVKRTMAEAQLRPKCILQV